MPAREQRSAKIVALLALFFALAGTAVAAGAQVVISSSSQVKNGVLLGADIRNDSVPKTKLTAATIAALAGKAGEQGPPGPAGPSGQTGPAGPAGPTGLPGIARFYVKSTTRTVPGVDATSIRITCDSGDVAVGGGVVGSDQGGTVIRESWAIDARTWETRASPGGVRGINGRLTVYATCADLTP